MSIILAGCCIVRRKGSPLMALSEYFLRCSSEFIVEFTASKVNHFVNYFPELDNVCTIVIIRVCIRIFLPLIWILIIKKILAYKNF